MKKEYTTLYKQRRTGKFQEWKIWVTDENGNPTIYTRFGLEEGEMQTAEKVVSKGKNIGKSNETSAWDQAVSEADSMYQKRLDKGYNPEKTTLTQSEFRPMLAHPFEKRPKLAEQDGSKLLVQAKLDGVRGNIRVSDGVLQMYSRMGKNVSHNLKHILNRIVLEKTGNAIIDGEIYSLHPDIKIQEIAGLVNSKEYNEKLHPHLCYIVYDIFFPDKPELSFEERFYKSDLGKAINNSRFSPSTNTLFSIDRIFASHKLTGGPNVLDKIKEIHSQAVAEGFEGVMIRHIPSPYQIDKRSEALLKYKTFQDSDYPIVGCLTPETGKDKDTAVFICQTPQGKQFNVRPRGTHEYRAQLYKERETYINSWDLTVRFQDLTNEGIPRFPVGINLRQRGVDKL